MGTALDIRYSEIFEFGTNHCSWGNDKLLSRVPHGLLSEIGMYPSSSIGQDYGF